MPTLPDPAADKLSLLIVDADASFATELAAGLTQIGYKASTAANPYEMVKALPGLERCLVICDIAYVDKTVELLSQLPATLCVGYIVMARNPDLAMALKALRQSAWDFFDKASSLEDVLKILERCGWKQAMRASELGYEMLRNAKEAAEQANRAKTEFLATMSHELRTPLNAIIGFSDVMLRRVLGPLGNDQYQSYIEDINAAGRHLLQIINDILNFSKVETGKMELLESDVDVREAVLSVTRLLGSRARGAGIELHDEISPTLPPLWCDERKLRQMLLNLLTNAVKFTPSGGRIDIEAACGPQGYGISVRDSGVGISKADLDRVVLPFVQSDNSLSRRHEGTGLGLPLVKAMIEVHGGKLLLESEVGAGTTARLLFPPDRVGASHEENLKGFAIA